ncbi:GATS protein-like 3 [Podila verticillata]|nr:GATS protein-like 3 [Podila verticillata]
MDEETLSRFPDNSLNTQAGIWRLIAIGDGPLGFDECGIVSEFSRPLSEHEIQLFYLSTFHSDYIMVSDQDFEDAVKYLEQTAKSPKVEDMVRKRASISSVNSFSSTTRPEQEDGLEQEQDTSGSQDPVEEGVPV